MKAFETISSKEKLQIGMPHLDIFGLSESFCLASSGNHHWSLISKFTSKTPTEWKNVHGERIYASFVYTSIAFFRDYCVKEDDIISIECVPCSLQAPLFITETNFFNSDSEIVVTVRLMSTFSATNGNCNNNFTKSSLKFNSDPFGSTILQLTKKRCKEMRRHDDKELKITQEHIVNPSVDFNAANFMYFANYCQIFKRYESPELSSIYPLEFREIAYFGNVNPFESVTVFSHEKNRNVMSAMNRSSDQKCIARSYSMNFPLHSSSPVGVFDFAKTDMDKQIHSPF